MNCHELCDIFEDLGFTAFSYSGRGMYGKRCLAINIDRGKNLFELGGQVARRVDELSTDGEIDFEWMSDARTDSLGKGVVLYFPEIPWDEEGDQNEETCLCGWR